MSAFVKAPRKAGGGGAGGGGGGGGAPTPTQEQLGILAVSDFRHDSNVTIGKKGKGWKIIQKVCNSTIPGGVALVPGKKKKSIAEQTKPAALTENKAVNKLIGGGVDNIMEEVSNRIGGRLYNEDDLTFNYPLTFTTNGTQYTVKLLADYRNRKDMVVGTLNNILENRHLFLVVDTKRPELYNIIKNTFPNKCSWIETIETKYDPSSRNIVKEQENSSPAGSGVVHALARREIGTIDDVFFPKWDGRASSGNPNRLFYCTYNINLIHKNKGLFMKLQSGRTYWKIWHGMATENVLVVLAKHNILRKGWTVGKALLKATKKTTKKLFVTLLAGIKPKRAEKVPAFMAIGKRLGDQGQALACLRNIHENIDKSDYITGSVTNVFVTYDRLAFVAAILYRVPAVIFQNLPGNKGGKGIFIAYRSDLESPEEKAAAAAAAAEANAAAEAAEVAAKAVAAEAEVAAAAAAAAARQQWLEGEIDKLKDRIGELHGEIGAIGNVEKLIQTERSNLDKAAVTAASFLDVVPGDDNEKFNNKYKNALKGFLTILPQVNNMNALEVVDLALKAAAEAATAAAAEAAAAATLEALQNFYEKKTKYTNKLEEYVMCLRAVMDGLDAPLVNMRNIKSVKIFGPHLRFGWRGPPKASTLIAKREVYSRYQELKSIIDALPTIKTKFKEFFIECLEKEQTTYKEQKKFWIKQVCEYIELSWNNDHEGGEKFGLDAELQKMRGGGKNFLLNEKFIPFPVEEDLKIRTYVALVISTIDNDDDPDDDEEEDGRVKGGGGGGGGGGGEADGKASLYHRIMNDRRAKDVLDFCITWILYEVQEENAHKEWDAFGVALGEEAAQVKARHDRRLAEVEAEATTAKAPLLTGWDDGEWEEEDDTLWLDTFNSEGGIIYDYFSQQYMACGWNKKELNIIIDEVTGAADACHNYLQKLTEAEEAAEAEEAEEAAEAAPPAKRQRTGDDGRGGGGGGGGAGDDSDDDDRARRGAGAGSKRIGAAPPGAAVQGGESDDDDSDNSDDYDGYEWRGGRKRTKRKRRRKQKRKQTKRKRRRKKRKRTKRKRRRKKRTRKKKRTKRR